MARQRTPDSQPPKVRRFAGVDDQEADVEIPTSIRDWLLQRRKMLAALIGIPVTYAFLKLGLGELLGAELAGELKAAVIAIVIGALVEKVPNKPLAKKASS